MEFQFDKLNEEILKMLLESKEAEKIIIIGSYALYKIHFKNINQNEKNIINIKDLDFDINDLIKNDYDKKEVKKIITGYFKDKLYKIFNRLEEYENINNYEIAILNENISERINNKGNFGLTLELRIYDEWDEEHRFKIDIGIETKKFILLDEQIKIFDKTYNTKVYTLEKMLADKYLAIAKRLNALNRKDSLIINEEPLKISKMSLEGKIKSNYLKLSKDLYDINFIKQNNNILNRSQFKENLVKMANIKDQNKINQIIDFITQIWKVKRNDLTKREQRLNFDKEVKEFNNLFLENEKEI